MVASNTCQVQGPCSVLQSVWCAWNDSKDAKPPCLRKECLHLSRENILQEKKKKVTALEYNFPLLWLKRRPFVPKPVVRRSQLPRPNSRVLSAVSQSRSEPVGGTGRVQDVASLYPRGNAISPVTVTRSEQRQGEAKGDDLTLTASFRVDEFSPNVRRQASVQKLCSEVYGCRFPATCNRWARHHPLRCNVVSGHPMLDKRVSKSCLASC